MRYSLEIELPLGTTKDEAENMVEHISGMEFVLLGDDYAPLVVLIEEDD